MNCTSINFEGKEIKFSSDLELDLFLESIRDKYHVIADASLSVDLQRTAEDKLKSITDKVKSVEVEYFRENEDGDVEPYYKIPGSIGTTKCITTFTIPGGTSPLVPPFDEAAYFNKLRSEMQAQGLSDQDIEKTIKEIKESWKVLTDYGSEVHAIFEAMIQGTEIPTVLPEGVRNAAIEYCKKFIEHIKNIHGDDCKFLSEVPLVTDNIAPEYKNLFDSVNGRADLIVVDRNGVVHIYDFKVSRKEVGKWNETNNFVTKSNNWWHTVKKLSAGYQMAIYKAILQQHGIKVGTTAIVPVKIDLQYNSDNKNIIEGIQSLGLNPDDIITGPTNDRQQKIIDQIFPVPHIEVDLHAINEEMSWYFGEYSVSSQVKKHDMRVESAWDRLVSLVPKGTKEYEKGYRFKFYSRFAKGYIYCTSKEEAQEKLGEYVSKNNEDSAGDIVELGNRLYQACQGSMSLDEVGNYFHSSTIAGYVRKIFKKYVVNGWELDLNDNLLAAGLFVFKNHADNVIEVVSLTDQKIFDNVDGLGNSIFGHFGVKMDDEGVGDKKYLSSTYASTEAIKTLAVLNNNTESWKSYKINRIEVFNIWEQHGENIDLESLNETYRVLGVHAKNTGNTIANNIKDTHFTDVVSRAMITAKTALGGVIPSGWDTWPSFSDFFDADEYLQLRMEELREYDSVVAMLRDPKKNFDASDPHCVAYMELAYARAKLRGVKLYSENNIATLMHASTGKKGRVYTGLNVNAPQNSPSLNAQMVAKLEAQSASEINRKTELASREFRKAVKKLKDYKYSILGPSIDMFDNLFVRDAEGKIDKSFRLKDPSRYSDLADAEIEFIHAFLNVVNSRRYPSPEAEEQAKADGSWFDIPLTRGDFNSHVHNSNIVEGLKEEWDSSWNPLNLLKEQNFSLQDRIKEGRPFNKFTMSSDTRNTLLGLYDTSHFETHLEKLGLEFIKNHVAEEVHNQYLPMLHGIQIALQYQQSMYGNDNKEVIDYVDKFITSNVYSAPIMDEHLQGPYKVLSAIKNVTTASALGLNFRSGLRELMQGVWIHISRSMAESYGRDQFTKGELAKAWGIIFKDTVGNINTLTLVDALNVQYRMANADNDQIATLLSQTKMGIKNFDSDKLYFCNKFPDTYHRMGILIAKMIHDGCWEAHTMVDDVLVYDFSKDARFDLLFKDTSDKNSEEYKKQHALYTAMRLQFIKEGEFIEEGQPLPRAYTTQEGNSIKSFAELCFGHYDKNTQMLAKKMFLGSMMLQFRTFLSAKLEQWILKPGTYDQGHYVEMKDPDGVRLVRVYTEDEEGNTHVEIMREDQLKGGEHWEPMIDWQGRFMEGILYSLWDFGKALVRWDTAELKKLWDNPTKKANLKIFLWDMVWMHILMAIVGSLVLYNDEVELNPVEWTFASALYTSFQDGPIDQIVNSMFSDLNPPMMGQLQRIFRQAGNMATGDQGLGDTIVNTFGALAPLKHLEEAV